MKSTFALVALTLAMLAAPARSDDAAARRELAPNGKLRVAIAVGPTPSALYAIKDGAG